MYVGGAYLGVWGVVKRERARDEAGRYIRLSAQPSKYEGAGGVRVRAVLHIRARVHSLAGERLWLCCSQPLGGAVNQVCVMDHWTIGNDYSNMRMI